MNTPLSEVYIGDQVTKIDAYAFGNTKLNVKSAGFHISTLVNVNVSIYAFVGTDNGYGIAFPNPLT